MDVTFADDDLEQLYTDPRITLGYTPAIVKAYRKRMQVIVAADDERDFYALTGLHYEKLKGKRQHQRSMMLNSQFRLIIEIQTDAKGKYVKVVSIEDYH